MKIYMVHSNFTWFSHLKSTYFMSSHKINATTHLSSSMFVGQLKSNITLVCELSPSLLAYMWDFISMNLLKSKNFVNDTLFEYASFWHGRMVLHK